MHANVDRSYKLAQCEYLVQRFEIRHTISPPTRDRMMVGGAGGADLVLVIG